MSFVRLLTRPQAVALFVVCALAASASAWSFTEWDAATGDWWTAANWTNGVPNGPLDKSGYVNNGGTLTIASGDPNTGSLTVLVGHVDHTGGSLTALVSLGNKDYASPTYTLSGSAEIHGGVFVGSGGYVDATFTQDGGLIQGAMILGYQGEGCVGTYEFNAGRLEGPLYVGEYAEGHVVQYDGVVYNPFGFLIVGEQPSAVGTHTQWGGEVTVSVEEIGFDGRGTFDQYGGTNTMDEMRIGYRTGSVGEYNLHDGGELICDQNFLIGSSGEGTFAQTGGSARVGGEIRVGAGSNGEGTFSLSGGTCDVGDTLWLGYESGSSGIGWMSDGELTAWCTVVGYYGAGEFHQTGGAHIISGPLYVGGAEVGCVYELGGTGELSADEVWVGDATISQSGASAFDAGMGLYLNGYSIAGRCELGAEARLTAGELYVAFDGLGEFDQTGGEMELTGDAHVGGSDMGQGAFTHSAGVSAIGGDLHVASGFWSTGTYELSGTGELSAGNEYIGDVGDGRFTQTGGLNTIADSLYLGCQRVDYGEGCVSDGNGLYELGGTGELSARVEYIGYGTVGVFIQDGGTHEVTESVQIGCPTDATGTMRIYAGTFTTPELIVGLDGNGTLDIAGDEADITVTGVLHLGPGSTLLAAPDSYLRLVDANYEVSSSNGVALDGLYDLTLIFEGGADSPRTLEAASLRDGGLVENFAIGRVLVGHDLDGNVRLVDEFDSGNRVGLAEECLFAGELLIEEGSTLDLSGKWLYVDGNAVDLLTWYIEQDMLIDSTRLGIAARYDDLNDWTVVPEPTTLCLLALALPAALLRRRRPVSTGRTRRSGADSAPR